MSEMSEITEAKTSMKKIISIVDEIIASNSDSIPKLKTHPIQLLELIEQFESEKNTNIKTIEANTDETNSLKNKISQNNRDIIKLEEEIKEQTKERQKLLDRTQKVQDELTNTKEKITSRKSELESRSQRLSEIEERIQKMERLQEEFEEKMKVLEAQLQSDFDKKYKFAQSFENRVEAMKALIRMKYISSDILRVIQALQKDVALDLENIVVALDISPDKAKKILRKIVEENGPIQFDESAGTVKLTGEVDF